jgi:hypothetical protein
MSDAASKPAGTPAEIFVKVLDGSATWLAPEYASVLQVPDDELHREILLPLLPSMLADKAIRQGWREGLAGFFSRVRAHVEGDAPAPRWLPHDFEIPVASSYLAGPDAKALADTLLSEPSLRDLTADLMNRVLDTVWPRLPGAVPATPKAAVVEMPVAVKVEPPVEPAIPEPAALVSDVVEPDEPEIDEPVVAEIEAPETTAPESAELEVAAREAIEGEPAEASVESSRAHVISTTPAIRVISQRRNPIRGTRHTFGGLASRNPFARNPLGHLWPPISR